MDASLILNMCVCENVINMTICLNIFYIVNAQVQDLDCDGIDNTFTVAGTDVTFACTITLTPIRWDIQPLDAQINFKSIDHNTVFSVFIVEVS